jgi:hypothetical protein
MDTQSASPLLARLPGELRNQIYKLVLTADYPITDPSIRPGNDDIIIPSMNHFMPVLGVPLVRTCRFIYNEISLSPLFRENIFRFTSRTRAHEFLTALPKEYACLIREVEVDLRNVSDRHPPVAQQWIQYISGGRASQDTSSKELQPSKLKDEAPGLKTLRVNIEGWSRSESLKSVVLLQDLFKGAQDVERVIVTGADGSAMLGGAKARYLQQWGPVIFIGVMRFARLAGVMAWMADRVKGDAEEKVVRWTQEGRAVSLEVMTREFFSREGGSTGPHVGICEITSGCCSLSEYEERWQSRQWPIIKSP